MRDYIIEEIRFKDKIEVYKHYKEKMECF